MRSEAVVAALALMSGGSVALPTAAPLAASAPVVRVRVVSTVDDETPIGSEVGTLFTADPGSIGSRVTPLADLVLQGARLIQDFGTLRIDAEDERIVDELVRNRAQRSTAKNPLPRQ